MSLTIGRLVARSPQAAYAARQVTTGRMSFPSVSNLRSVFTAPSTNQAHKQTPLKPEVKMAISKAIEQTVEQANEQKKEETAAAKATVQAKKAELRTSVPQGTVMAKIQELNLKAASPEELQARGQEKVEVREGNTKQRIDEFEAK